MSNQKRSYILTSFWSTSHALLSIITRHLQGSGGSDGSANRFEQAGVGWECLNDRLPESRTNLEGYDASITHDICLRQRYSIIACARADNIAKQAGSFAAHRGMHSSHLGVYTICDIIGCKTG
jgi:hypothetical protein